MRIKLREVRQIYQDFAFKVLEDPAARKRLIGMRIEATEKKVLDEYLLPGKTIDLGCAAGRLTRYLRLMRQQVFGVDINQGFIDEASRKHPLATFFKANVTDIDTFPSELTVHKFDNLVCLGHVLGGAFTEDEQNAFAVTCRKIAATKARLIIDRLYAPERGERFRLFGQTKSAITRGSGRIFENLVGTLAQYYPSQAEIVHIARKAGFNKIIGAFQHGTLCGNFVDHFVFEKG